MRPKFFLVGVVVAMGTVLAMGAGLSSLNPNPQQYPIKLLRTVTDNDTSLTGSTKTWTSIESLFTPLDLGWDDIYLQFLAYSATDPENGTFHFKVYLCRDHGSAEMVCEGDATVGEVRASHHPQSWAALSAANYKWADVLTVATADNVGKVMVGVSGKADEVGALNVATNHEWGVYCEITAMTGVSQVMIFLSGCEAL